MRRLFLLLSLALAGCAPFDPRPELTTNLADAQRAVTAASLSGRTVATLVASQGGIYRHDTAAALVEETLADLVRAAGIEGLPATVAILNSPGYNAFSLPDGRIFLSRGMLALANDQAEIAAALGHELGHVISRHVARRVVERARAAADAADVDRTFGDADITRATIVAHQLSLAEFSRNQELEADRISIGLLAKAGYDPAASLRMLQSLERVAALSPKAAGGARRAASPVATHPPTPERIAAVREELKKLPATGGRAGRDRYLAAIAGVAFGDDGAGGFVRGQIYVDPARDIAMTLPKSWRVFATPSGFGALKRDGDAIALVTALGPAVAAAPEAAMRRLLAAASPEAALAPLPAGGAAGWAAAFERENTSFRLAIFTRGETAWRVVFGAKPRGPDFDADFARTLASIRAPDARDRSLARPLALRVARADGPDALRRLAGRAGDAENGADLILAINGLSAPGAIHPGASLKIPDFATP